MPDKHTQDQMLSHYVEAKKEKAFKAGVKKGQEDLIKETLEYLILQQDMKKLDTIIEIFFSTKRISVCVGTPENIEKVYKHFIGRIKGLIVKTDEGYSPLGEPNVDEITFCRF